MPFTKGHKINNGRKKSAEVRRNMSLAQKNNKNNNFRGMFGEKNYANRPEVKEKIRQKTIEQFKNGMPEETKKKLSIIHTGMKHSEETKEKIRLNHRRHQTPETIKKIIEVRRKNNSYFHIEETKIKIRKARMKQVIPLQDTNIEIKLQK